MNRNITDFISRFRVEDRIIRFDFLWYDKSAAALLRLALHAFIRTYAPCALTLTSRHTDTSDFLIVHGMLGLIVDNRDMIIPPVTPASTLEEERGNIIRGRFEVTGPCLFTTGDIPRVPWFEHAAIAVLGSNETIQGYIDIACDTASIHPKHAVFVNTQIRDRGNYFEFECTSLGHLTSKQIYDQIDYAYLMAMRDPNKTIYTKIDIPDFPPGNPDIIAPVFGDENVIVIAPSQSMSSGDIFF